MQVSVKVWAPYACFTRPELKVERLSYPILTPSAARGVLEAILWRPQMRWHVRRITALKPWVPPYSPDGTPYWLVGVRRNEIQDKIAPRAVSGWINRPESFEPYLVDSAGRESIQGQNRTQRNTLALRNVAYRIDASIFLTCKANRPRPVAASGDEPDGPDSVAKYVAMFNRRVERGQCFHRPYLGCREFAADFAPVDGQETPLPWTEDLGLMLYDLHFTDQEKTPGFFEARVVEGVVHCDSLGPGPRGEPPITVKGWPEGALQEAAS